MLLTLNLALIYPQISLKSHIYNAYTLKLLQDKGLKRWVMPVELSANDLAGILEQAEELGIADNIETELFAWGHLPLAFSARCFSARYHDLGKDDCRFVCLNYPDGIAISSQEGERVFTLNGIQTQSGRCNNLLSDIARIKSLGVDAIRLSPGSCNMLEVIESFRQAINGDLEAIPVAENQCDGYWFGQPGMLQQSVLN